MGPRPERARKICGVAGETRNKAGSPYACVRVWIAYVLGLSQHIYSGWSVRSLESECSSDYCKT